jgi:hypothetical protein
MYEFTLSNWYFLPKMEEELWWNVTLGLRKLEWIPRKIL